MGLVEELLEHISLTTALLLTAASYILFKVYIRVDKHYRLQRLGARAPRIRHKLPFGKSLLHMGRI